MARKRAQPARSFKTVVNYYTLSTHGETAFRRTAPRHQLGAQSDAGDIKSEVTRPDADDIKEEFPQPDEELFECARCGETKLKVSSLLVHRTKHGIHARKGRHCVTCRVKQMMENRFSNADPEDAASSRKEFQKACFDFIESWSHDLVEAGQAVIEYEFAELQDNLRNYIDGFFDGLVRQTCQRQSSVPQGREVVDDSFESHEDLADSTELTLDEDPQALAQSTSLTHCRRSNADKMSRGHEQAAEARVPIQHHGKGMDIAAHVPPPSYTATAPLDCHQSRSYVLPSGQHGLGPVSSPGNDKGGVQCIHGAVGKASLKKHSGDDLDGSDHHKQIVAWAPVFMDHRLSLPFNAYKAFPAEFDEYLRSQARQPADQMRARADDQRSRSKGSENTVAASPSVAHMSKGAGESLFSTGFGHRGSLSEQSGETSAPAQGRDSRDVFAPIRGGSIQEKEGCSQATHTGLQVVQTGADERAAIEGPRREQAVIEMHRRPTAVVEKKIKGLKTCGRCHRGLPLSFFVRGWTFANEDTCLLCHVVRELGGRAAANCRGLAPAALEGILRGYSYSLITGWKSQVGEAEFESHKVFIMNEVESYFSNSEIVPKPIAVREIMVIDDSDTEESTSAPARQAKRRRVLPKSC